MKSSSTILSTFIKKTMNIVLLIHFHSMHSFNWNEVIPNIIYTIGGLYIARNVYKNIEIHDRIQNIKDQNCQARIYFSHADQLKIESIQSLDELRKSIFFTYQFIPFYKCDPNICSYNPHPHIDKEIPLDAIEIIKLLSERLQVKVDNIIVKNDINLLAATRCVYPKLFTTHTYIGINVDEWNRCTDDMLKIHCIIHELAHIRLQHSGSLGISGKSRELQADTYFALYGPAQETITDISLEALEPYKKNDLSGDYVHSSSKEIYTILTHAKKLREQEQAKKKK